jgi:ribonuclease BN (tRNA processing enzyme)
LQDKRASSSYLVWQDGQARVLVDAGGGSALRFGESGAKMSQLDVILFTHIHVDHSADFPALMFSSWFEDRHQPLPCTAQRVTPTSHRRSISCTPSSIIGTVFVVI